MTKKDTLWKWNEHHEQAFNESKKAFLTEILVVFLDFIKPFYLNTDASSIAIGGELYQILPQNDHVTLGFASRTLKPAETRYTTTEIEALAVVYCCDKFRQYLIGHKVIIITDHQALTFMKTCRLTNGTLTRWIMALQEFDLEIRHVSRKNNIVADILTRYPIENEERSEPKIKLNIIKERYSKELNIVLKNLAHLQ